MKFTNYLLLGLIIISLIVVSCKKNNSTGGLPSATQSGANTLGFLLNGQLWIPQGQRVTANLSIDYDKGYKNGIFSIVAYNFIPTNSEQFIIGLTDSLNFQQFPKTFSLGTNTLFSISYNTPCDYFNQLPDVTSSGTMTVTKLDTLKRIISGTFDATLYKVGCDTIRITEGRFDMSF